MGLIFFVYTYIRGKATANYPQESAQDVVCQSHTGHMTGLWFLPARPLRLNANEWMTHDNSVTSLWLCERGGGLAHWHSSYENCICAIILNALEIHTDWNFKTQQIKKENRVRFADSGTNAFFLTDHSILLRNWIKRLSVVACSSDLSFYS